MGVMKLMFFVAFTTLIFSIGTEAWFFNEFGGDERADLSSVLSSRIKDLEPLGSENVGVTEEDDNTDTQLSNTAVDDMLSTLFDSGLHTPNIFAFVRERTKLPWWKSENVCITRKESNETHPASESNQTVNHNPFLLFGGAAFETCRSAINKYICVTNLHTRGRTVTTEVTYKCCPGSRRDLEKDVCVKVDIKSAIETAKSLEASKFADTLEKSIKQSVLETPNITIFAPSDKAINAFWKYVDQKHLLNNQLEPVIRENNVVVTDNSFENEIPTADKTFKEGSTSEKLLSGEKALGHIVSGSYDVHDLENEEILKTIDGLPIRINMYHGEKKPIVMANCALIKFANHPLPNDAVLHVTDGILPVVKKSIKDMLDENAEFSTFKQMLENTDLLPMLGEPGNFTVFIPTNDAVEEAKKEHKLIEGKDACIKTILKSHIIGRTICGGAVGEMKVMTRSMSGNWLTLERENASSILVGSNSRTTISDIVANNGVVHIISDMIVPSSAQPVNELLTERNHTTWLKLVEKAGLTQELEETANRTIFVPSEEALAKSEIASEDFSPDVLKDIIRFHISSKSVCSCQMTDNLMLPSILPDRELRVNTYETGSVFIGLDPTITVQCGLIIRKDEKACNFMVHEVDRVLTPATENILDIITSDPSYSVLRKIMAGTTVEAELKNGTLGPITLLAPSDEVFSNLTKEEMQKLEDKTTADQLLRRHVLTDIVCCNGIGSTSWPFSDEVITVSGTSLNVRRKNPEQVMFGGATTTSCDRVATDGLIHSVDRVMMPRPISLKGSAVKYIGPNGSEIVLLGI